jgi:hypothetical protein
MLLCSFAVGGLTMADVIKKKIAKQKKKTLKKKSMNISQKQFRLRIIQNVEGT